MKKSLVFIIGLIMVAVLAMASCQGTSTPQGSQGQTVPAQVTQSTQPAQTTAPETTVQTTTAAVAGPQYGGTFAYAISQDTLGFDEALGVGPWYAHALHLTNEELLQGDWANGPAGTGKYGFQTNSVASVATWAGCIAESWELKGTTSLIFHIRHGIYWQNKPPVNGRELNADDVVFSLKRNFETPGAYLYNTYPKAQRPTSITAPDKWTVVVECPEGQAGELLEACGDVCRIVAPEAISQFGPIKDWRNVIGTGPFLFVDYVPASSMRYARNPNYWATDPLNPTKKLPYVDYVKILVIPDASTSLAALRTGKSDMIGGIGWEERADLRKAKPDLGESMVVAEVPTIIFMRTDKAPFNNIKVRQALAMGLNRKGMVQDYYKGNASLLNFPVANLPDLQGCYTPVDQLPQEAKELFDYNPTKAKQLLADAGYPTGFKASIVIFNAAALMDLFAIVKDDWSKIGVELQLDVREYAVWTAMTNNHNYDSMIYRGMSASIPYKLYSMRPGTTQNISMINDPHINDTYPTLAANYFNQSERDKIMKEVAIYSLKQGWMIQLPATYGYIEWWPWVHNFEGAVAIGRNNQWVFPKYLWVDAQKKAQMTSK